MTPLEKHTEMLQEIQDSGDPVSVREEEFLDGMEDRLGDHKPLTPAQAEWLQDIWDRVVGE